VRITPLFTIFVLDLHRRKRVQVKNLHHRVFSGELNVMVAANKSRNVNFSVGDEVSYAFGSGIVYGEIARLLEGGAAVEIQFEDGRREIKKSRDGALRLLRRASGASELEEQRSDRNRLRDNEIGDVFRSDKNRRR
jgi:exosome complex RNA-binding protein Csl4